MATNFSTAGEIKERIVKRVAALRGLPTTVAVAVRLFELQKDPHAQAADYARIIASDAGMTARLLALVNSSWFGLSQRITQPMVAVNLLGVAAVRTLVINLCLSGLHHELKLSRAESRRFWEASLCKAVAARHVARRLNSAAGDEAYVAGLFQDMALPVMYASARAEVGGLYEARMNTAQRLAREREVCGADHCVFGGMLARRLGLAEGQVKLVEAHHDWETLTGGVESAALAAGVYAASLFPHQLDRWHGADVEALRAFLASEACGGLEMEAFLGEVSAECRQEFAYFDGAKATEVKLAELMAEAVREAAEAGIALVGQVQELKSQMAAVDETVSRLAEEASRDPLTGILNRAAFERECRGALVRLQRDGQAAALMFLDVDRFKEINDLHGHAAGDAALKQLAQVMQECVRGTDRVGRLGGDEFGVLLANCPKERTAEIAERIRGRAAKRRVEGRQLSVSIGVRWVGAGTAATLEWLMTASDQRMYAAKRDGGNLVRMAAE